MQGIAVGLTFAIYILYPASLIKEWGELLVAVWGMLTGGLTLEINCCIWRQICCFCAILSRNKMISSIKSLQQWLFQLSCLVHR